jgi:capsular polysaccharide transport system permease protein
VRAPAGPARLRRRHWGLAASFVLAVLAPAAAAAWYLWWVALDQYESRFGFAVQREDMASAVELLGGITEISGQGAADTDILDRFIRSRQMVLAVNRAVPLAAVWTRREDPVFSLPAAPVVEDIEAHWARKVAVYHDTTSHLIEVRVLAFDPGDATRIATAIRDESARLLDTLTAAARADATRHSRAELAKAEDRLRAARAALTAFRVDSRIVDPEADLAGRMGLLNTLVAQQAEAMIELDLVRANTANPDDPRIAQAERRLAVIAARVAEERTRFGEAATPEEARYADLVARFEALAVDLDFAQQAYVAALAAHDAAQAEAERRSRYLVAYVGPTAAERSEFPQRPVLMALVAGGLFTLWAIAALVALAVRDRR